jgi:hypothetical protein
MTFADPAQGIQRLRALVNDDLFNSVDPGNNAAVIGWGTTLNVMNFVDGIVQLHQAGKCSAASPLRRSALEYAMATVWLADAPTEAAAALNDGFQHKMSQLVKALKAASVQDRFPEAAMKSAQAVRDKDIPKSNQAHLLHASHLLDEYDNVGDDENPIPMRVIYDVESWSSHASLAGAQLFFTVRDDGQVALGTKPMPAEDVPCLMVGLSLLFTTMLSYNELLIDKPWTGTLRAVAEDFGFDPALPKRRVRPPKGPKPGKKT